MKIFILAFMHVRRKNPHLRQPFLIWTSPNVNGLHTKDEIIICDGLPPLIRMAENEQSRIAKLIISLI